MSGFNQLLRMHERLRGKKGCPWDKKQTFESFAPYLEEETMEILEEVRKKDYRAMKDELGDLFWNILFMCQMAKEKGLFDVNGIMESARKKMAKRHPHVFGNKKFKSVEEVEKHWNKIKGKAQYHKQTRKRK